MTEGKPEFPGVPDLEAALAAERERVAVLAKERDDLRNRLEAFEQAHEAKVAALKEECSEAEWAVSQAVAHVGRLQGWARQTYASLREIQALAIRHQRWKIRNYATAALETAPEELKG